jgi:hypothetical protein
VAALGHSRPGRTSSSPSHVRYCSVRYQKRCAAEATRRAIFRLMQCSKNRLFDDLVCASEEGFGDRQAKRLRCFKIHD